MCVKLHTLGDISKCVQFIKLSITCPEKPTNLMPKMIAVFTSATAKSHSVVSGFIIHLLNGCVNVVILLSMISYVYNESS